MRLRDWRAKAVLQGVFSTFPGGHHANYAFQRILGGLPRSDAALAADIETGREHVLALQRHGVEPGDSTVFEFGAGFDLHMPLIQHGFGINRHVLVDIRKIVRPSLVIDIVKRLVESPPDHTSWLGVNTGEKLDEVLIGNNIAYYAPVDAAVSGLAAGSIDAVLTSNTLEHIPPTDLVAIYGECHRVLRTGGLMSMMIDYSDHWSHFDRTLSPYNFLRFENDEWGRWNPSLMYQNRLRHSEHLALLAGAGFEILENRSWGGGSEAHRDLERIPLSACYAQMDPDDLAILGAHVVLRRGDA